MSNGDLIKSFTTQSAGEPLMVFPINDSYVLAIYRGQISPQDIIIKYKQKNHEGRWSRLRTPKHIHWAVDVLLKLHAEKASTQEFLDTLLKIWDETQPLQNEKDREELTLENLAKDFDEKFKKYNHLSNKGEYSIRFLILLAKLLMIQEKTNRRDAYMFRDLLSALRNGREIYGIVSTASFGGRNKR